ncbi:MAG: hypothetical protein A3F18_07770 [Legionellales bacterium RIFCSPHIGHO2_12_FULL_37_14]|nr:MAG: hypothetical protein A3F18_07770 [Legionellales bacterium RIFCSPHIGHO2_12_FULL_37_14]
MLTKGSEIIFKIWSIITINELESGNKMSLSADELQQIVKRIKTANDFRENTKKLDPDAVKQVFYALETQLPNMIRDVQDLANIIANLSDDKTNKVINSISPNQLSRLLRSSDTPLGSAPENIAKFAGEIKLINKESDKNINRLFQNWEGEKSKKELISDITMYLMNDSYPTEIRKEFLEALRKENPEFSRQVENNLNENFKISPGNYMASILHLFDTNRENSSEENTNNLQPFEPGMNIDQTINILNSLVHKSSEEILTNINDPGSNNEFNLALLKKLSKNNPKCYKEVMEGINLDKLRYLLTIETSLLNDLSPMKSSQLLYHFEDKTKNRTPFKVITPIY